MEFHAKVEKRNSGTDGVLMWLLKSFLCHVVAAAAMLYKYSHVRAEIAAADWLSLRIDTGVTGCKNYRPFAIIVSRFWWAEQPLKLGGGWFDYVLFSSLFGELIQFDEYFSDGLKPPTSLLCLFFLLRISGKSVSE